MGERTEATSLIVKASERLGEAVARLERSATAVLTDDTARSDAALAEQVVALQAENDRLREDVKRLAGRLDTAIDRLRAAIGR